MTLLEPRSEPRLKMRLALVLVFIGAIIFPALAWAGGDEVVVVYNYSMPE
jgi:hypothetical protein